MELSDVVGGRSVSGGGVHGAHLVGLRARSGRVLTIPLSPNESFVHRKAQASHVIHDRSNGSSRGLGMCEQIYGTAIVTFVFWNDEEYKKFFLNRFSSGPDLKKVLLTVRRL